MAASWPETWAAGMQTNIQLAVSRLTDTFASHWQELRWTVNQMQQRPTCNKRIRCFILIKETTKPMT